MKIDTMLLTPKLGGMADYARAAEGLGFQGIWTAETQVDPFLPLAIAAEHTERANIGTAIAVAFARSPATLAYLAWDLQRYSNGRFILGLGPQVKAHNVLRFGVKWEKPVKKMRETIEAIRAFWHTWQTGAPFRYVGEFFDAMLDTLVVCGTWAELPGKVKAKYGDRLDRISTYLPFVPGEQEQGWRALIAGF